MERIGSRCGKNQSRGTRGTSCAPLRAQRSSRIHRIAMPGWQTTALALSNTGPNHHRLHALLKLSLNLMEKRPKWLLLLRLLAVNRKEEGAGWSDRSGTT